VLPYLSIIELEVQLDMVAGPTLFIYAQNLPTPLAYRYRKWRDLMVLVLGQGKFLWGVLD
jgi:hypothetical protein